MSTPYMHDQWIQMIGDDMNHKTDNTSTHCVG